MPWEDKLPLLSNYDVYEVLWLMVESGMFLDTMHQHLMRQRNETPIASMVFQGLRLLDMVLLPCGK